MNHKACISLQEFAAGVRKLRSSGYQGENASNSLAEGTRDDTLRQIFSAYDSEGRGFITFEEMRRYLLSVFLIMRQRDDSVFQQLGYAPRSSGQICI